MRNLMLVLSMLTLAACAREDSQETASPPPAQGAGEVTTAAPPPEGEMPSGAVARLTPASGSQAAGELTLRAEQDSVRITGTVTGLDAEKEHGFHIHENGDCSAPDASSAGGHFNPVDAPHGHPDGAVKHAGDMLNLQANGEGVAEVDVLVGGVTLQTGETNDILNKAIVVHAKPDDYKSQPSGASGDRIACGVIQAQ